MTSPPPPTPSANGVNMQPDKPITPPGPSREDRALEGRALADARRAQMRRRAGRIRRTIAASAAALFAAAFIGVYVQLASGHDPALVASAAKRSSTSALAAAGSSSGESETGSGEESSSFSAESEESAPSSVTTSQS